MAATPAVVLMEDAVDQLDHATGKQQQQQQHDDDFDVFTANAQSVDNNKKEAAAAAAAASNEEEQTTTTTTTTTNRHDNRDDALATATAAEEDSTKTRYVTPKDFELLKVIGMGAFGKVLQVRNKTSQQVLAMKIISKRLLRKKGAGVIENITAERNILTKVPRHPFVVAMHCSFQSREKLFIIMDFLAGGELFLRLGREGIFLEKTAAFYLAEIILAIDHLHHHGILHRDLKPENILLSSDGHVCLTDFGLAKDFGTGLNDDGDDGDGNNEQPRALTICGTQEYMAPEMVARKGYGRAADYWSLGCIAYEMLSGQPPFESRQGAKVLFSKIMGEKIKMPAGSSAEACKLLKGLLNRNVQARLGTARSTMFEVGGVAGLKKADFFARHVGDWDRLEQKQMEPPAVFSVDHDGDVQHFHDEFTSMALPRSVYDMSLDDFQPRRVQSEAFRGFSFIQDDFDLPDRDAVEVRSYWDSVEEDGESLSECASSKMEADLDASPPVSAKKKRPPRKRKKKKAQDGMGSAVSTPAGTAANTPEPSESGNNIDDEEERLDESETKRVGQTTVSMAGCTISQQTAESTKAATTQPLPSAPVPRVALPPKPKPEAWQTAGKKSPAARSNKAKSTPQKQQQQQQSNGRQTLPLNHRIAQQQQHGPWTGVAPKRQAPGQLPQNNWKTPPPAQQQRQQQWTGWGSAASPQSKKPVSNAGASSSPASPSSDWRQHPMSPRDGRPVMNKPPTPGGGGQTTTTTSWPSLGGPPLGKPKNPAKKLQGAWASKS